MSFLVGGATLWSFSFAALSHSQFPGYETLVKQLVSRLTFGHMEAIRVRSHPRQNLLPIRVTENYYMTIMLALGFSFILATSTDQLHIALLL